MQRLVTVFTALALLVIPTSTVTNAATIKAGAACSKVNQTQIVGQLKYTCIKSGKKLVWDKGVKIVTPKPSPTPSPVATKSPTPSPTPTPTQTSSPAPTPSETNKRNYVIGWVCDSVIDAAGAKDSNGVEIVCVKGSDGVYSWAGRKEWEAAQNQNKQTATPSPTSSESATPTPSPTQTRSPSARPSPSPSQTPSEIILNGRCNPNIDSTGKTKDGKDVTCIKNSAGVFMWTENAPPVQSNSLYPFGTLGDSCTNEGSLGWSGFLAICKGGKVKYALPSDIPVSATGFKSKPDWYPSLAEINMPGPQQPLGCTASSIIFTHSVVPLDQIGPTIPYGMVVGDHVTPIDHAYITLKVANKPEASRIEADYQPVMSPADGTIISVSGLGNSPTSHRVVIDHGCGVYTVYMVLNRFAGVLEKYQALTDSGQVINPKLKIKAGETFGLQRDNPIDFNVWDGASWLSGFANPGAYITGDTWKPYTVDYLPFFTQEIRSVMESQLQRTSAPRIGKIDFDTMGGAAGNWYLKGYFGYGCVANSNYENATKLIFGDPDTSKNYYAWCHLSIAPHNVDPSAWILSTGWWKNPAGDSTQAVIVIGPNQVAPDKLTNKSGTVIYKLTQVGIEEPAGSPAKMAGGAPFAVGYKVTQAATIGYVAIRIETDGSISIEFTDGLVAPSGLSNSPRSYTR